MTKEKPYWIIRSTNQYFMYGTLVPFSWHREWETKTGKDFYATFEKYIEDKAYDELTRHKDGIFCLFNGRDGKFIIIGRLLKKSCDENPFLGDNEPLKIPTLEEHEKIIIEDAVYRHFDLQGEFNYYFVTRYK